jgi:hypothetical protein
MPARLTNVYAELLRSTAGIAGIPVHAATTLVVGLGGDSRVPIRNVRATTQLLISPLPTGGGDMRVAGEALLIIRDTHRMRNTSVYADATTGLGLAFLGTPIRGVPADGGGWIGLSGRATASLRLGPRDYAVGAITTVDLSDLAEPFFNRSYLVEATTALTLPTGSDGEPDVVIAAGGVSGLGLRDRASALRIAHAAATTALALAQMPRATRDVFAVATTAMGLAPAQGSNRFLYGNAAATVALDAGASATFGGKPAGSTLSLSGRADARVLLPSGGGTPGGAQGGPRTVLLQDISGEFPNSYAETPGGLILVANGIDPMARWDGLTGLADTAGVVPPATAPKLGGIGVGTITGRRAAFVRFLDRYGNPSDLSPVSNEVDFGRDQLIEGIDRDPATGRTVVRSVGHGLKTGEVVVIEEVEGAPQANGTWAVTRLDADRFRIDLTLPGVARHTRGGRWVWGVQSVVYGDVPVPSEPKVVRRQILRNLDGNADAFYVDIDTDDLASTVFVSTKDDEALATGLAVPLFAADERPMASRHAPPPSHKAVIAAHLGRIFAAGDAAYTRGNCEPLSGRREIKGIGTAWRRSFRGRLIYMAGARQAYEIASVDEATQTITTTEVVRDALGPFARYSIRPPAAERRLVYFTEPALPESWPAWNAIPMPEDSDEITGLMVMGSFLYILERRHIYKLTVQDDPARDGFVFPSTRRGCVNNRCHVQVEDAAYLLDEVGIHRFDGQDATPVSTPIQNVFQQAGYGGLQVNWQADTRYWHAAHDPMRDTIRWFAAMTGHQYPRHAICYDYRRERFWIEAYPFAVTSSTVATIGFRRSLAGSEARRVLCLGEGSTEVVNEGHGLRGTVTSSGPLSLTDAAASFPAGLAGAPVSIASGKGVGQQRKIVANTATTLTVDRPWLERPDASSVYQVGGIDWTWRSGWFRYVDQEADNRRDVEIVFQPTRSPSSMSVRLYYDHGAEPRAWARTIEQDGVATEEGRPEITVDLAHRSGFAAQRITGHRDPMAHGDRFVSVELAGVQAGEPHRIYQVTINGVREP